MVYSSCVVSAIRRVTLPPTHIDANEKMVKPVIKLVQKNRFRAAGVPEDNFGENYV